MTGWRFDISSSVVSKMFQFFFQILGITETQKSRYFFKKKKYLSLHISCSHLEKPFYMLNFENRLKIITVSANIA